MLPSLSPVVRRSRRGLLDEVSLKRIAAYAVAVVLPWAATAIGFGLPALRSIRLALTFSAIAAVAALFERGPASVSIVTAILAFNYYVRPERGVWTFGDGLIRIIVILIAGLLIAWMVKQRREAEQELRATLAHLQEQADALAHAQQVGRSAAWSFDTGSRLTQWYPGGSEIFGKTLQELASLGSPTGLIHPEDRPKVEAAMELTERTGVPFHAEFRVTWPNGEVHWLEARGTPLASNPGRWLGVTVDVTGRKNAEAALIRTEKLAVAGRLAASIAHEINNPLEAVTNLCYLAKLTAAKDDTRGYLEMAESELARIAQIASQTLRFHRQQSAAVETDLEATIRSILLFYQRKLLQAGIGVVFDARPAQPLVCLAGEIRQVLTNLIGNAVDAMPAGGRLRLRLRPSTDWRGGTQALRITVADTGHGMSRETLTRIYEPFYTTKENIGTGLGLWVTAGIVEKHHGSLRVRSSVKPGRSGSVFALVLPYPPVQEAPHRRLEPVAEVVGATQ